MRRFTLFLCCLLAVIMYNCGEGEPGEAMVLKIGHYANAEHAGNTACQMFADAVESRTNGMIKIEIYPNNELGNPPEVL